MLNSDGDVEMDFGEQRDYKDFLINRVGNRFHFAIDKDKNTYVAFDCQNRIEKYSPDGKTLWKADRELNYSTDPPKTKSDIKREGGMVSLREPQMNRCSNGIAVDDKGRIWVVNLKRQIKEEEGAKRGQATFSHAKRGQATFSVSLLPIKVEKGYKLLFLCLFHP